jgi:hypothetical protein
MPARDMLARLAVFYLAAIPEREGALIREPRASFEVEGLRWFLPDSLTDRDELLAIVTRHRQARRAAVGGNEALLGSRRADAVWLDITDRERPLVEVHEIKTSRGDLVSELRQPEKSAAWMQRQTGFGSRCRSRLWSPTSAFPRSGACWRCRSACFPSSYGKRRF